MLPPFIKALGTHRADLPVVDCVSISYYGQALGLQQPSGSMSQGGPLWDLD